jgi:oligoribonuclease NrnB/cAMP/cGMP phosphodiesterase (DHH superfamily)
MTLSILKSVQTIYTHKNCPDGTASAMILKQALNLPIVFLQYGTEEYTNLQAIPGMLFCDTTPPHNRAQEFVDAGAFVLDHHKGAQDVVAMFGDRGVFADEKAEPGVCGAVLAYREVWVPLLGPDEGVEDFAKLAGVRDTWQIKDPRWDKACAQSSWVMFFGEEECLKAPIFWDPERWEFRQRVGEMLFAEHMRKIAKAVEGSFKTSIHGLRIAILQGATKSSDSAEMLGEESKVDIVVGFSYYDGGEEGREQWSQNFSKGLKLVCSCRTRTDFDVSKLAKFYGGGGHTKAAGFTVQVEECHYNPYLKILGLINNYIVKNQDNLLVVSEIGTDE